MTDLANTSYRELDIGQKLFILEECGIDQSLCIEPWYLAEFSVNACGVSYIEVEDGIRNKHSRESYERKDFDRIFLTLDDAIKYCEENGRAYSFLKR